MFTHNTWDSSDINSESEAREIYIWTVECITHKHRWGWFDWLVLLQAYKLSSQFSPLLCSLFYQTGMLHQATSVSGSLILLVVSQQTSHWLLHAFRMPLFSRLKHSVKQVLTADLSARAGRLLIVTSMNSITGPTNTRTEPGYKLNCNMTGWGGRPIDWTNSMVEHRYLTVL